MGTGSSRLSATGIAKIKAKGRYADGNGLYLRVSPSLNKSWVFRWIRNGRATEIGFGRYPDVTLADARNSALEARRDLLQGKNPKIERDKKRVEHRTLGFVADEFLRQMGSRWNNEKTRWQWHKTLRDTIEPIRGYPISSIDTEAVLLVLKPMWQATPETAKKTRMRLEQLLDFAKANGWLETDNPARWRGHLKNILPPLQKLPRGHHPAMDYREVPTFLRELRKSQSMSARALELIVLTACRSGEAREATWDEINWEEMLWIIPASRMKAGREHRIPLTESMIRLLRPLSEAQASNYVFPGQKPGKPLSNISFKQLLKRMGVTGTTPHGFRSSFRDWAGDKTSFAREIAEAALAHRVGDSAELAYRRGDALEKRRHLMNAWSDYCDGKQNIVSLAARNEN